jgi:cytochrome c553
MRRELLSTLAIGSIVLIFGGCSDEVNEKKPPPVTTTKSTPKIEVISNDNVKEIKVQERGVIATHTQKDQYYYDYHIKSEYNANSRPANKDASVRSKPRTAIEANMNIRSPYEEVKISMIVRKLSKKFMVKCSACHNDYANGVIGPSLLGKSSNEIFNAIADFKSGKKVNVLMNDLIKGMSDDEIRAIADEIYKFNKEIEEARG